MITNRIYPLVSKHYDNQSNDLKTLELLKLINLDKSIISILGYFSEVSN